MKLNRLLVGLMMPGGDPVVGAGQSIGFSNLVTLLYPLYGVLNLLILTMILRYPFTKEQ